LKKKLTKSEELEKIYKALTVGSVDEKLLKKKLVLKATRSRYVALDLLDREVLALAYNFCDLSFAEL